MPEMWRPSGAHETPFLSGPTLEADSSGLHAVDDLDVSRDIARSVSRAPPHQRHGLQEPFPVFENLALPALRVETPAASSA